MFQIERRSWKRHIDYKPVQNSNGYDMRIFVVRFEPGTELPSKDQLLMIANKIMEVCNLQPDVNPSCQEIVVEEENCVQAPTVWSTILGHAQTVQLARRCFGTSHLRIEFANNPTSIALFRKKGAVPLDTARDLGLDKEWAQEEETVSDASNKDEE